MVGGGPDGVAWVQLLALVGAVAYGPLSCCAPGIEDLIGQMMGGQGGGMGGGGQQFQFNMGGGGGGRRHQPVEQVEFELDCDPAYEWIQGTTWNWNNWKNVKFEANGKFTAPDAPCEQERCSWRADAKRVYIECGDKKRGEAGLHVVKASKMAAEKGTTLKGKRKKDQDPCTATFVSKDEIAEEMQEFYLYKILGVDEDSTDKQIKKAYHKLSMKYHPDKNHGNAEAETMFKKVAKSYEILSNPELKMLYDMGGMEAVQEHAKEEAGGGGGGGGMLDMFFGGGGGGGKRRNSKKGPDANVQVEIDLADMYTGKEVEFNIQRRVVCRGCRKKSDGKCEGCVRCPNEVRMKQVQVQPGMFMQQQEEVRSKEKCKDNVPTPLKVEVERGVASGHKLTFPMMSEQKPGQIPGDVIVELRQKKHPRFRREGNTLHVDVFEITLKEALLGFSKTLKHLDQHEVPVTESGITKPGQTRRIKGEGMPHHNVPSERGDLVIKYKVIMPKTLTPAQRETLQTTLP
jgi:DnaJ-class molecular chaperone